MGIGIVQIDAFTMTPFAGNPVAVCLLTEPRDDQWLQDVAREMNLLSKRAGSNGFARRAVDNVKW